MPSNWQSIDMNFPSFTGDESPRQQIQALHNYLFQLRQGLQYSLQNLGVKNFNTTGLKDLTDAQTAELKPLLENTTKVINNLSGRVNNLEGQLRSMADLPSRIADIEEWTAAAESQLQELSDRLKELESILQVGEDGSVTVGVAGRKINFVGEISINGTIWQPSTEEEPAPEETPEEEESDETT